MANISVNDTNQKTKNHLIKCLQTARFKVTSTENNFVQVQLPQDNLSTNEEITKSNEERSIFPSIPRLNHVFEFIELNYHQPISLKEVAQAVGYSSAYLTDLARKLTGKTVNYWIIERRITQACDLLLKTNYSIHQISLKVGYQNTNHFYSQFRKRYNTTPHAWRKAQR